MIRSQQESTPARRLRYPSADASTPPPVPHASSGDTILFCSGSAGLGALQPAPYARAVARIDITGRALEIGFLAAHYPVADDEREGYQHHQQLETVERDRQADQTQEHAEVV